MIIRNEKNEINEEILYKIFAEIISDIQKENKED